MTIRDSVPALAARAARLATQRALPAVLVLLLAACGGGGADEPAALQDPPVTPSDANDANDAGKVAANDQTLLALVNAARAEARQCGETAMPAVPAMQLNATVKQAAVEQANWVRESGVMSHAGRGGSTLGVRVTATGYEWEALGENLARGYNQLGDVVQAWLASPGHCLNIMGGDFTEVGFHHIPSLDGDFSVTAMVSARPR